MTTPVIYIISLAAANHRRSYQAAQAQRLGFAPIWSAAVGMDDISDAIFYQHAFQWQRALKKTEVACFMSHLALWQTIAAGQAPAVVLEDDVVLADNWLADVQCLASYSGADYICLETWGKKTLGAVQHMGHLTVRRLYINSAGAAGYMLWPAGAQHLLARYQRHGMALADAFINQTQGWRAWQLVPANVVQMSVAPQFGLHQLDHSESLIAREKHASALAPNWGVVCQMKWRRLQGECVKAWCHITTYPTAQRAHVPFQQHSYQKVS